MIFADPLPVLSKKLKIHSSRLLTIYMNAQKFKKRTSKIFLPTTNLISSNRKQL